MRTLCVCQTRASWENCICVLDAWWAIWTEWSILPRMHRVVCPFFHLSEWRFNSVRLWHGLSFMNGQAQAGQTTNLSKTPSIPRWGDRLLYRLSAVQIQCFLTLVCVELSTDLTWCFLRSYWAFRRVLELESWSYRKDSFWPGCCVIVKTEQHAWL